MHGATDEQCLERQQERGWLLPYLLELDIADIDLSGLSKKECKAANIAETAPTAFTGWGRWAYWLWIVENNRLPDASIPQIPFTRQPDRQDARAVQDWLKPGLYSGGWYDDLFINLTKWLLHGFGRRGLEDELQRIDNRMKVHWYRSVNLANLLHSPTDWPAFVLQGNLQDDNRKRSPWSNSTGFF